MSAIGVEVLVGARARNDGDAVGFAHIHGRGGDAGHAGGETGFGAHHAVHPDVFDAEFHALLNDLIRHFGIREQEDRIRFGGDGSQVGVTGVALERSDARVDGEDLIARILEFCVGEIASCIALV